MQIQAITLFPEMFTALTDSGVTGRALRQGIWQFAAINPRQFADNPLGHIDDRPFGGGPGMIMMAPPLQAAIDMARQNCPRGRVIYMSPQGKPLNHAQAASLAKEPALIVLCGRYEGIDERILTSNEVTEISIGDFVVSGGELPAMMLMDAVIRLLPGTLGDARSAVEDSFANGLLDCPHYTRPVEFRQQIVPDVLRSGNHALIAQWRLTQALRRTLTRRPDLLANRVLTPEESRLLQTIRQEERDIPL
ncbi:tRNA (guanosine(37)-N1)-methyltransferase TrmD [Snodgrassella alvi]|jgi:tRNA (guanine37-N1)-methyltransferase|uniref:tRNA (guanine-N(1)-)-methyltransferase n=1 Tax=Snodgrassella alvi TaxID=1196083 RepID=A0A855FNL0_9NEIS|nr:tRNA (guanosine(37)-N1)-methyltransferase TrmD [Snodgrassella alvi]PIT06677.1 tRNA (guanosine(37)-N1)-methyltransferase TrmD [Snodgrassella alvi]PIT23091.1 tRNA (guanosine(37)-N1)-methyltransferase TrmD [Snodgrassella alvi]PIT44997.1 tRNA (guanosine(37)-N1)-methyltransferase TrmD [Snodgrassella alvi]PIT57736.1 tRNA (guanosine(37)-N1)-methyltransferase TrmD [Snodgrassella alvi]PIT59752.1 tRNA (guanosine(37)-N1)-methyltransferase TrmD [Snodgrassella alvi]